MGGRTLPTKCEHGKYIDGGDFMEAEVCKSCTLSKPKGDSTGLLMGWIATADKLPEEDRMVLAYFKHGGLCEISVAYYDCIDYWFEVYGDSCISVDAPPTHWMPLPEPPAH